MKKLILALLAVVLCAAACTPAVDDDAFETSVENGNVTITAYTGSGGNVDIPSRINGRPVTIIGDEAFNDKSLISVTIPDSVIIIGYFAFANNYLKSVTIPETVTDIKSSAFLGNQLNSVTIPYGVTTIADSAFKDNKLSRITIPNSVTTIERDAFNINLLPGVTILNSVTAIKDRAFDTNPLTSVDIGANVDISSNAFPNLMSSYYTNNGKKAGVYTYNGNIWNYSPR
jgi:hypothetical protein